MDFPHISSDSSHSMLAWGVSSFRWKLLQNFKFHSHSSVIDNLC